VPPHPAAVFFRLGKVNTDKYVKEALNSPLAADSRLKVSNGLTSPSAAAALAYMKTVAKDGLCGLPTEVYLQTIFSGKSKEEANAEATKIYIEASPRRSMCRCQCHLTRGFQEWGGSCP
jgi:hypothetical protein